MLAPPQGREDLEFKFLVSNSSEIYDRSETRGDVVAVDCWLTRSNTDWLFTCQRVGIAVTFSCECAPHLAASAGWSGTPGWPRSISSLWATTPSSLELRLSRVSPLDPFYGRAQVNHVAIKVRNILYNYEGLGFHLVINSNKLWFHFRLPFSKTWQRCVI